MLSKNEKFRFWDVLTLSFSHFAHDVYTSFLSPVLPLIIKNLGISYSLAGLLSVIRGLPSLLNPFIGLFIDKKGGKIFVILGPTITAITMTMIGIAPNYGILVVLLLFTGINSTFFHVPVPVMVKKVSGNKTGFGMSMFMVGGELARSAGPIIVLAAIDWWGFSGIWKLIPFGIIASLILFWRLRNLEVKTKKEIQKQKLKFVLKKIYGFFSMMILFLFFVSLLKMSLTYYLPVYMQEKGYSMWFGGASLSVLQFAGLLGALWGGYVSDKIGRYKILFQVWILIPLFMFLFVFANKWVSLVLLVLLGLSIFVTTPVLLAYVHDIKCNRPAFMNSLFMVSNFGVNALAALLIGLLADKIGLILTFRIVTVTSIFTLPFIYFMHKKASKISNASE